MRVKKQGEQDVGKKEGRDGGRGDETGRRMGR